MPTQEDIDTICRGIDSNYDRDNQKPDLSGSNQDRDWSGNGGGGSSSGGSNNSNDGGGGGGGGGSGCNIT